MSNSKDDSTLERAVQGETEAFCELYERYVGQIYNYIYYRTGNLSDAEDLTARVFYRALSHIQSYRKMGVPFSAWLYRIAHNLVANWYRDNQRRKEVPLEDYVIPHNPSSLPEYALVKNQETEKLLKIIRTYPPERQHLLILKFVEDMSNIEIAVIMGRSEGAIKGLYHRTLLALRQDMGKTEE